MGKEEEGSEGGPKYEKRDLGERFVDEEYWKLGIRAGLGKIGSDEPTIWKRGGKIRESLHVLFMLHSFVEGFE